MKRIIFIIVILLISCFNVLAQGNPYSEYVRFVTSNPATCPKFRIRYNTTTGQLIVCTATNTWTSATTMASGQFLASDAVNAYSFLSRTDIGMFHTSDSLIFSGGGRNLMLGAAGLTLPPTGLFGIGATGTGDPDIGFSRNAAGILEINNGTPGTFRDLKLRQIFTVDVTNTLQTTAIKIGLPDVGAISWHSNFDGTGAGDVGFMRAAAGVIKLNDGTANTGYRDLRLRSVLAADGAIGYNSALPTSIANNGAALATNSKNSGGKFTTTTTGAVSIVLTFSVTFTNGVACTANNNTTANILRVTTTTTTATFVGTTVNGDTISYVCMGY